jgi:tetratricopeptide (TPR) repeat protein
MFIGSYGETSRSIKLKIGRLGIWIRYSSLIWGGGLCSPDQKNISYDKIFVYTIAGPLASLFIATFAAIFIFEPELHGFIRLFLVVLMGSSCFDFIVNLIPIPTPIKLDNGQLTYNDGQTIKNYLQFKKLPKLIQKGIYEFESKNYNQALTYFNLQLKTNKHKSAALRHILYTNTIIKEYTNSIELLNDFLLEPKLDENDYILVGFIYFKCKEIENAIKFTNQALEINSKSFLALNNKASFLTTQNAYDEALELINLSIKIEPKFANAYLTKGSVLLKLGRTEEALELTLLGQEIDPNIPYIHINLAEYHILKGEKSKALEMLKKAKEMDQDIDDYDELYERAINL